MFPFTGQLLGSLETPLHGLLSYPVPLLADLDSVLAKLSTEDLFQKQDGLEGLYVDLVEQPLKTPANTLAGHAKCLVDLLPVGSFQHHVARLSRLQLDPKVFRLHQGFQVLQKGLVFLGQFHFLSP